MVYRSTNRPSWADMGTHMVVLHLLMCYHSIRHSLDSRVAKHRHNTLACRAPVQTKQMTVLPTYVPWRCQQDALERKMCYCTVANLLLVSRNAGGCQASASPKPCEQEAVPQPSIVAKGYHTSKHFPGSIYVWNSRMMLD